MERGRGEEEKEGEGSVPFRKFLDSPLKTYPKGSTQNVNSFLFPK